MLKMIMDSDDKASIARQILEALPQWFGIPESREQYIADCRNWSFFATFEGERPVGFLCLKETGKATMELAVMGVLPEFHRRGIGRRLFAMAREYAVQNGYAFLQVKTVQMGQYPCYDDTNRFYLSLGFQEFEVLKTLWGEANSCQIYIMSLI